MVTIAEIVTEMKKEGYKISPTTIKYYIDIGLMPEPDKIGGYGAGVKLSFPDKREALSRLKQIYGFKGRGYKLSEIKLILSKPNVDELKKTNKKYMKQYIEMDGQFLRSLKNPGGYQEYTYENFINFINWRNPINLPDMEISIPFSVPEEFWEDSFITINDLGLYYPTMIYQDKLMLNKPDYSYVAAWMILRHEYDIDWDIQEALFKKHKENMDNKYWFWPKPDNVRFSMEEIETRRREHLNILSGMILGYFIGAKDDFFKVEPGGGWSTGWDYSYDNPHMLIDEFLEGKCAFVREARVNIDTFLVRF